MRMSNRWEFKFLNILLKPHPHKQKSSRIPNRCNVLAIVQYSFFTSMWRCHSKGPVNKLANGLSNWIYFKGHPFSLTVRCSWPSKSSITLVSSVTSLPSILDSSLITVVCCLSIGSLMNSHSPEILPPEFSFVFIHQSITQKGYHENMQIPLRNVGCHLSVSLYFVADRGSVFPEMTNQPTLIMAQKARQWKSSGDQTFCQLV